MKISYRQEYDKEAWFDVCKKIRPDLTEEEFEELWEGYLELRRKMALN